MSRPVLADTGPLYAAVDPDDAHHRRAHREMKRLAGEQRDVAIAYPTLLEAYTLVLHRLGRQVASNWLKDILSGAVLLTPSPEDYRAAVRQLAAFEDQPITLFDSTVAAMSARLGLEVWSYDHHFDLMRAAVWR